MIKVFINEKREVINFLWGYGYTVDYPNAPKGISCADIKARIKTPGEVIEVDYPKGITANDKKHKGINRYYLDSKNNVIRRTDEEIEALPEFQDKIQDDIIEKEKRKQLEILALENVKKTKPELSEKIDQKIDKIKNS